MSRTAFLAVTLLAAVPACKTAKGVDIEASALVPKDASLVVGFELDALGKSPLGGTLASSMAEDPETKALFDGFENCEVDLEHLEALVAGSFTSETYMAVIESPGLGEESVVRCIEREIGKATGESSGIIMFETKGDVRITPQEGGGHLIILNKNAIVIADAPWDDEVLAAIENAEKRNTDGPMATMMKEAGSDTDVWMAASIGSMERAEFSDVPGSATLETVLMKIGLGDGVTLDASFGFTAESDAEQFRTAVPALVGMAKPELPGAGLPADLLDTLEFGGEGNSVTASWSVKPDALAGLATTLGAM
ncbi:MAG: hypothetical protein ACE37F_00210 [Nannocystaceae bacterium]|nr:hypothetical protein [bacterium]